MNLVHRQAIGEIFHRGRRVGSDPMHDSIVEKVGSASINGVEKHYQGPIPQHRCALLESEPDYQKKSCAKEQSGGEGQWAYCGATSSTVHCAASSTECE